MPRIISSCEARFRDLSRVSEAAHEGECQRWHRQMGGSIERIDVTGIHSKSDCGGMGADSDRARRAASGLKALPRKVALPSLPARRSLRAAAVGRKSLGIVI